MATQKNRKRPVRKLPARKRKVVVKAPLRPLFAPTESLQAQFARAKVQAGGGTGADAALAIARTQPLISERDPFQQLIAATNSLRQRESEKGMDWPRARPSAVYCPVVRGGRYVPATIYHWFRRGRHMQVLVVGHTLYAGAHSG